MTIEYLQTTNDPIMNAAGVVARPPHNAWVPKNDNNESIPDERTYRIMGRLATRCVGHINAIRSRAYRLGHDVNRAVWLYSHTDGLAALSRRIEVDHSMSVTPQSLGNALNIYRSYSPDEYENRFSTLTDTHLLKAQQMLGQTPEERNHMLTLAQQKGLSVSSMVATIKESKARDEKESPQAHMDTLGPPHTGYILGNGKKELDRMQDRSVRYLRLRWPTIKNALIEAKRVLAGNGLILVDCPSISDVVNIMRQVPKSTGLCLLHVLVINSDTARDASRGLPFIDCYRLVVLLGQRHVRLHHTIDGRLTIPAMESEAEAMILRLIPDTGRVVDLGNGSISTALWAQEQQREFLALEPDKNTYDQNLLQLSNALEASGETERGSTPKSATDNWPAMSDEDREGVNIDGVGWDDMNCCDRTLTAAIKLSKKHMECPTCNTTIHPKY